MHQFRFGSEAELFALGSIEKLVFVAARGELIWTGAEGQGRVVKQGEEAAVVQLGGGVLGEVGERRRKGEEDAEGEVGEDGAVQVFDAFESEFS